MDEAEQSDTKVRHLCDICGKDYSCRETLTTHRKKHAGVRPHKCKLCDQAFTLKCDYKVHLATHYNRRPFLCDICGKQFADKRSVKTCKHIEPKNIARRFECNKCGRAFTDRRSLTTRKHICRVKCKEPEKSIFNSYFFDEDQSDDKKYACVACGKKYAFEKALQSHVRQCPIMIRDFGHTFFDVEEKLRVENLNSNKTLADKKSCNLCGKKYKWERSVRRHKETCPVLWGPKEGGKKKMTAKVLPCMHCGKKFGWKKSVRRHQDSCSFKDINYHPNKQGSNKYSCNGCGKTFALQHSVKRHKMICGDLKERIADTQGMMFEDKNYMKQSQAAMSAIHDKKRKDHENETEHNDESEADTYSVGGCSESDNISLHDVSESNVVQNIASGEIENEDVQDVASEVQITDSDSKTEREDNLACNAISETVKNDGGFSTNQHDDAVKTLSDAESLVNGGARKMAGKVFPCIFCGREYSWKLGVLRHQKTCSLKGVEHNPKVESKKKYLCNVCGKKFAWEKSYKSHEIICEGVMQSIANFQHSNGVKGPTLRERNVCKKQEINPTALKKAKPRYVDSIQKKKACNLFSCRFCGKKFKLGRSVRGHQKTCSLKQFRHTPSVGGKKKYPCNSCGKTFSWKRSVKRHQLTHLMMKPNRSKTYSCHGCGKKYWWERSVRRHKETCSSLMSGVNSSSNGCGKKKMATKVYPCMFCGRTFGWVKSFKRHQKMCSFKGFENDAARDGMGYSCVYCGKMFALERNVERHQVICGQYENSITSLAYSALERKPLVSDIKILQVVGSDGSQILHNDGFQDSIYDVNDTMGSSNSAEENEQDVCDTEQPIHNTAAQNEGFAQHIVRQNEDNSLNDLSAKCGVSCEGDDDAGTNLNSTLQDFDGNETDSNVPLYVVVQVQDTDDEDATENEGELSYSVVAETIKSEGDSQVYFADGGIGDIERNDEEGYSCSACGKTYKWKRCVRRHRETCPALVGYSVSEGPKKMASKVFPCMFCGRKFGWVRSAKRHQKTCSFKGLKRKPYRSDRKIYSCNACGKSFAYKRCFKNHQVICEDSQKSITNDVGSRKKNQARIVAKKSENFDTASIQVTGTNEGVVEQDHESEMEDYSPGEDCGSETKPYRSDRKKYPCNACGKRFTYKRCFKNHRVICKDSQKSIINDVGSRRKNQARMVAKKSENFDTANIQVTGTHGGVVEQDYESETEDYSTGEDSGSESKPYHNDRKKYSCNGCGKRFAYKRCFKNHQVICKDSQKSITNDVGSKNQARIVSKKSENFDTANIQVTGTHEGVVEQDHESEMEDYSPGEDSGSESKPYHSDRKKYSCNGCGKRFAYKRCFKNHQVICKDSQKSITSNSGSWKENQARMVAKKSENFDTASIQVTGTHEGVVEKDYESETEDYSSVEVSESETKPYHSDRKKYSCNGCGKRFTYKRCFKNHRVICKDSQKSITNDVGSRKKNQARIVAKKSENFDTANIQVTGTHERDVEQDYESETEDYSPCVDSGSESKPYHSDKKKYSCNGCGKRFAYERCFKNHRVICKDSQKSITNNAIGTHEGVVEQDYASETEDYSPGEVSRREANSLQDVTESESNVVLEIGREETLLEDTNNHTISVTGSGCEKESVIKMFHHSQSPSLQDGDVQRGLMEIPDALDVHSQEVCGTDQVTHVSDRNGEMVGVASETSQQGDAYYGEVGCHQPSSTDNTNTNGSPHEDGGSYNYGQDGCLLPVEKSVDSISYAHQKDMCSYLEKDGCHPETSIDNTPRSYGSPYQENGNSCLEKDGCHPETSIDITAGSCSSSCQEKGNSCLENDDCCQETSIDKTAGSYSSSCQVNDGCRFETFMDNAAGSESSSCREKGNSYLESDGHHQKFPNEDACSFGNDSSSNKEKGCSFENDSIYPRLPNSQELPVEIIVREDIVKDHTVGQHFESDTDDYSLDGFSDIEDNSFHGDVTDDNAGFIIPEMAEEMESNVAQYVTIEVFDTDLEDVATVNAGNPSSKPNGESSKNDDSYDNINENNDENITIHDQEKFTETTDGKTDKESFQNNIIVEMTDLKQDIHKGRKIPPDEDKTRHCGYCEQVFASHQSLLDHVQQTHDENISKDNVKKPQSSHLLCDICGKEYASKASLSIHCKKHSGKKPHKCNLCDRAFTLKNDYRVHLATHYNRKPFLCDICGKAFADKRSVHRCKHKELKTPMNKPFICNKCGRTFADRRCLTTRKHICRVKIDEPESSIFNSPKKKTFGLFDTTIDKSTGRTLFSCLICKKTYFDKNSLSMSYHSCFQDPRVPLGTELDFTVIPREKPSGVEKYLCNKCGRTFSSKKSITRGIHKCVPIDSSG